MALVSKLQDDPDDESFPTNVDQGVFSDEYKDEEVEDPSATLELARTFDPSQLGLGHFFTYAASNWTSHFSKILEEEGPTPTSELLENQRPIPSELIDLCRPNSKRLRNWVYQWRRPNCTRRPENEFSVQEVDLDPLVVTAMFGPAASLANLLRSDLQPPDFLNNSVWTAVRELAKRGHISSIMDFLRDTKIGPVLRHPGFSHHIVPGWCALQGSRPKEKNERKEARLKAKIVHDWEDVFDHLIHALRQNLLQSGNEVLCLAARNGCLILAKRLFKAGETDPDLKAAFLADNRKRKWVDQSYDFHQSIGEAVWEGHADVVDFLCQQPGTEHHLRYVNYWGHTVFHQWARFPDIEVFRILLHHWPEGIHLRNNAKDTPVQLLIFNRSRDDEMSTEIIATLRMMRDVGNVDLSGKDGEDYYSPLRTAARAGKAEVCRFLITEGSADIYSLLEVDPVTGKPSLKDPVNTTDDQKELDEKRLLNELSTLLH